MYKENIEIKTFEGEILTTNIESVGKFSGGYKHYYDCGICKNQSVGDDNPFYCNNRDEIVDTTDTKMYCGNYKMDFEYYAKYGQRTR